MTREEVVSVLGDPDTFGVAPCSQELATIYKYGIVELYFSDGSDGSLSRAYLEGDQFRVLLLDKND